MLLGIFYLQEAYLEELSPQTKEKLKKAAKIAGAVGGIAALAGAGAAYAKGAELDTGKEDNPIDRIKMGIEYYQKRLQGESPLRAGLEVKAKDLAGDAAETVNDAVESVKEKGKSVVEYLKSKLHG